MARRGRPLKYGEETDPVHVKVPRRTYERARRYGKILAATVPHVLVLAVRMLVDGEPATLRALQADKRADDLDREVHRIARNVVRIQERLQDEQAKNRKLRDRLRTDTYDRRAMAKLFLRYVPEAVRGQDDVKRLFKQFLDRQGDPAGEAADLFRKLKDLRDGGP